MKAGSSAVPPFWAMLRGLAAPGLLYASFVGVAQG